MVRGCAEDTNEVQILLLYLFGLVGHFVRRPRGEHKGADDADYHGDVEDIVHAAAAEGHLHLSSGEQVVVRRSRGEEERGRSRRKHS